MAIAVIAGLLACGLPLWPLAYAEVSMLERPAASIWLLFGGLAGTFAGILVRQGVWKPAGSVGAGFVLAVMARVGLETAIDPTSHNLWPFEVVIAGGTGLIAGLIGVGVARFLLRMTS
jgi:hypothetical protein